MASCPSFPPIHSNVPAVLDYWQATPDNQKLELVVWLDKVWVSTPNSLVQAPTWMKLKDANNLVSAVLEHRAKQQQLVGDVPIKTVAEIRGSRFNTGKLRMDLIDPLAMEGLAAVLTKGAVKYSANNWRDGLPYTETIASMLRHISKFMQGEDIDPETGEAHVDHIQCNAMFLSNMTKTRKDMDDRWKPRVMDRKDVQDYLKQNKPQGESS